MPVLNAAEAAEELRREITRSAEHRYCTRVLAVLFMARGMPASEVGRYLGFSARALQKWVARYNQLGLAGLKDAPRPGRPPKLTPRHMAIIKATLEDPPFRANIMSWYWTGPILQKHLKFRYGVSLSARQCQRILRKLGYEKDPLLPELCRLYLSPARRRGMGYGPVGFPANQQDGDRDGSTGRREFVAPPWYKWRRRPGPLRRKQMLARWIMRWRGFKW